MKRKHTLWVIYMALACGTIVVKAQESGEGVRMDEVVVYDTIYPDYFEAGLSANVLAGDDLTLWGVDDPRELTATVPNFAATNTGTKGFGEVFSMRGLTNTRFFSNPSVVYYVDDVPFGEVFSYADRLYAVDYVEVFRGPQGSRFGKNAYGGAVQVRTKRPENALGGRISAHAGGYERAGVDGYVSGALIEDVLKFRLGGAYTERDGFLHNTFLDTHPDFEEHSSVSGALYWTPRDDLEVSLSGSWDSFDDGAPRIVSLFGDSFQTASGLTMEEQRRSTNTAALRVAYEGEDFDFLSVTARREFDLDPFRQDLDLTPFVPFSQTLIQNQTTWSEELRISSPEDSESVLEWAVGAYLATGKVRSKGERMIGFPGPQITDYALEQDDYAVFVDGGVPMGEKLRVTGGVRFDYVEKEMNRTKTNPPGFPPPPFALAPLNFGVKDSYDHVTPKVGVEYQVNPDVLLFATSTYAFKPGGFSGFTDIASQVPYDSEKTWATEAGVKMRGFGGKVEARLAGFYYDIDDYQVERTFNALGDYFVANAAEASSYGVELEASVEVFSGLRVEGSIGVTETTLDTYIDPITGMNLSGNRAPFVPDFDFWLAATWECECGFFTRVEYAGRGKTRYDDMNRSFFEEGAYGVFNAQVGYRKEGFLVAVYGTNLGDEDYFMNKTTDLLAGTPGEPRQVGVMVQVDF